MGGRQVAYGMFSKGGPRTIGGAGQGGKGNYERVIW